MKDLNFFEKVFAVVKEIPRGRVTTYARIAKALGWKDARIVGWALHYNKKKDVPCHRVVSKEGKLALNFAFGGWKVQRRRLLQEGVFFKDDKTVDLEKHLWEPEKKGFTYLSKEGFKELDLDIGLRSVPDL